MKKNIKPFSILFALVFSTVLCAQNQDEVIDENYSEIKEKEVINSDDNSEDVFSQKPIKLIQIGDELMAKGSNYNALYYYKAALSSTKKNKKKAYLNYQLGQSNFLMRDYKLAEKYYTATIDIDKKGKYPIALYNLANTYKHQAKYELAKTTYRIFIKNNENNTKVDFEKGRARLEIKGCTYADTLHNIEEYTVENAGSEINGAYSDFGPAFNNENFYHAKINSDVVFALTDGELTDDQYARIYQNGERKEELFNQNNSFIGNPTFSKDGNTMYYTQCELINGTQSRCDIYVSQYENGIWQEGIKLGNNINNDEINTTQPFITVDENGDEILYFVADGREKGKGGKDIWYAIKNEEGSFAKPKNIGYPLNTRYDDMSPFYDTATQTFYFSSNGHVSLGGFDVFSSRKDEDGEFQNPQNMQSPVNSSLDDYDFVLNNDKSLGYLVSNRIGTTTLKGETCCDDIFEVNPISQKLSLKGIVFEDNKDKISPLANIKLMDKSTGEIIDETTFKGDSFSFQVKPNHTYILSVKNINFEEEIIEVSTKEVYNADVFSQDIILTNRITNEPIKIKDDVALSIVYYGFNSAELSEDAIDSLDKVIDYMKAKPMCVVEVGAHTDSKGSGTYNEKLSNLRSEAAINYLIKEGIAPERLEKMWYGKEQPITSNTNEDGTDNPEGRALNRRTEFKVLRHLK